MSAPVGQDSVSDDGSVTELRSQREVELSRIFDVTKMCPCLPSLTFLAPCTWTGTELTLPISYPTSRVVRMVLTCQRNTFREAEEQR